MTSALATAQTTPRPRGERIVRRCLFVPESRRPRSTADAQRLFSVAMLISGSRCLLSYVVLPFIAPALGAATGVEPYFGIPISVIALAFDVRGMRRFWIADHRYRWLMTGVYLAVMGLVIALLIGDLHRLVH